MDRVGEGVLVPTVCFPQSPRLFPQLLSHADQPSEQNMRTVHPIQTPTASTQPPMAMASVAPGDSSQEQDQLDDSPVTPHVALPPTSLTSLASIVVPKASLQRTYSSQTRSEQVHGANGVGSHRSQQAHSRDSGPSDSSDTLTSMHTVLESSRHLLGPNAKQRPDGQTTAGWTMNENAHGAPSHHDANNGPSSSSQVSCPIGSPSG